MKFLKREIVIKRPVWAILFDHVLISIIIMLIFWYAAHYNVFKPLGEFISNSTKGQLVSLVYILWPLILVMCLICALATIVLNMDESKPKKSKK